MQIAVIVVFMLLLPCLSVLWEHMSGVKSGWLPLAGKWFVFWGVGARLLLAGLKQAIQPAFTAERIFAIEDRKSHVIVRELGFANIAIGCAALLTLITPASLPPVALAGALFFGLAGLLHVTHSRRNHMENWAMSSDLGIAFVLIAYLVQALI